MSKKTTKRNLPDDVQKQLESYQEKECTVPGTKAVATRKNKRGKADYVFKCIPDKKLLKQETLCQIRDSKDGKIGKISMEAVDDFIKNVLKPKNLAEICKDPNAEYFCRLNRKIPKDDMPQFRSGTTSQRDQPILQFINYLYEKGHVSKNELLPACKLRPTQSQLFTKDIMNKAETIERLFNECLADPNVEDKESCYQKIFESKTLSGMMSPIIISKDYYILDGHHRWAALLVFDFEHKPSVPVKINTARIDMSIDDLICESFQFACDRGYAERSDEMSVGSVSGNVPKVCKYKLDPKCLAKIEKGAKDRATKASIK